MLEPVLEHNRKEHDRLHRYQIRIVVSALPGALLIGLMVVLLGDGRWAEWATISLVTAALLIMGILELKKTLVFRRDLHEQIEGNHRD